MSTFPKAAFPWHIEDHDTGMTLRDYFAARAMQALLTANVATESEDDAPGVLAVSAYLVADAMLKERAK